MGQVKQEIKKIAYWEYYQSFFEKTKEGYFMFLLSATAEWNMKEAQTFEGQAELQRQIINKVGTFCSPVQGS